MDIIEELLSYMNKNNADIISSLTLLMNYEHINSLEELKEYDNKKFHMTDEEKIEKCKKILNSSMGEYEELDYDQIQEYKKYKKILDDEFSSKESIIESITRLFVMTHRELYFPVETYNMIINKII